MSQRTWAGLLAVPGLAMLWVVALVVPLPYVTYRPGPTVDILAERRGQEIVEVSGAKAYHDGGELRLTTIYVNQPQEHVNLFELMDAWVSRDDAVYPRSAVYAPDATDEDQDVESSVQMVSSQDTAIATALRELGYQVTEVVEVLHVADGLPAEGRLRVRDVLLEVGGRPVSSPQDVVEAVDAAPVDQPLDFRVRREGEELTVAVTPREVEGDKRVGISPGPGFTFPIDVKVDVGEDIGGPSAGLMFSLAIYDTLTPGSLTGDAVVAGTGTVDGEGEVGPIGGVQQKIAGARASGAELFLVPAGNCDEAAGVDSGGTRLVRVATVHEAVEAITSWVADPAATLPTCEEASV